MMMDDDVGMDLGEGLHDDLRAGDAAQEMHVHAAGHLVEELEHHAVHVGRREHGHALHAGFQHRAGIVLREVDVGVQGPVRDHHALGEAGGTGGIINKRQLLGAVRVVIQVFGTEVVGIFLAEGLVQVLTYVLTLFGVGIQELEGIDLDDDGEAGHLLLVEAFPDDLVHEEDAGLGMVHQVVDVAGLELVQDGHGHGAVGEGGEETGRPAGARTARKRCAVWRSGAPRPGS